MLEVKLPTYTKQGAKSRAQLEAEVAKEKYEEKLAEIEAQQEGSDLVAIAKKESLLRASASCLSSGSRSLGRDLSSPLTRR